MRLAVPTQDSEKANSGGLIKRISQLERDQKLVGTCIRKKLRLVQTNRESSGKTWRAVHIIIEISPTSFEKLCLFYCTAFIQTLGMDPEFAGIPPFHLATGNPVLQTLFARETSARVPGLSLVDFVIKVAYW